MKKQVFATVATTLICASGLRAEVVIETVPVGNPGNTGELSGLGAGGGGPDRICGAVDYTYDIGKFEVTAGQYAAFVNAVAADDTYGLYNTSMWNDPYGCKIERLGSPGSYSYTVASDWADRPVNFVSWGDAARFANWLHNGQPTGAQDLGTTEDGSYYLNGITYDDFALAAVVRQAGATWVIPSEDEWYKAAYHKNDGPTGNYYEYPTSADGWVGYVDENGFLTETNILFIEGGTDPGNYATWYNGIGSPYYRTVVGEWEHSASPYGTLDQGGNVWEWNEAVFYGWLRGIHGGAFDKSLFFLNAFDRSHGPPPTDERYNLGFRVVNVSSECGNGIVEFGEACDDGNQNDGDYCLTTCQRNWSVPAVSEWGLIVMLLVALAAGTLVFARPWQQLA